MSPQQAVYDKFFKMVADSGTCTLPSYKRVAPRVIHNTTISRVWQWKMEPLEIQVLAPRDKGQATHILLAAQESYEVGINALETGEIIMVESNIEAAFLRFDAQGGAKVLMAFHSDFDLKNGHPEPMHPVFHTHFTANLNCLKSVLSSRGVTDYASIFPLKNLRFPTAHLSFCQLLLLVSSYLFEKDLFNRFLSEIKSQTRIVAKCEPYANRVKESLSPFCATNWYPIN